MALNWRKLIGFDRESNTDTTGLGPDFPDSAGDRERGKFRPSDYPRLTKVAVSRDDGEEVIGSTEELLAELLLEVRLLRHALVLQGLAADIQEPVLN